MTPTGGPGQGQGESTLTVVVAGLANLGIAAAKAVGAMISGSSAMLSEAAHSLADTVSQVLLFVALRRSTKPPSARHPLGHGLEAYLWAFLASLAARHGRVRAGKGCPCPGTCTTPRTRRCGP